LIAGESNFFHGHQHVPAKQAKLILEPKPEEPILVYPPSMKKLQWNITAKAAYGVVDRNSFIHVFQVSPAHKTETETAVAKVAVSAKEFTFDINCLKFDPSLKLRFK
jgi:hypothetical protein